MQPNGETRRKLSGDYQIKLQKLSAGDGGFGNIYRSKSELNQLKVGSSDFQLTQSRHLLCANHKRIERQTELEESLLRGALAVKVVLIAALLLAAFNIQISNAQSSFIDNFDSATLGRDWHMIDDAGGSTFDLSANPGWLRIKTTAPPSRDLRMDPAISNTMAPRIMMSGVSDDFTIETKIMCTLSNVDQGAGIVVWHNNTQFVWLGAAVNYQLLPTIHFGITSGISSIGGYNAPNPIYLRLTRNGTLFTAYFSSDGAKWTFYNSLHWDYYFPQLSPRPVEVGLYVKDTNYNNSGSFSVDFDYFNLTLTPPQSPPTSSPTPSSSPPALTPTAKPSPTPSPTPTATPSPTPTIPEFSSIPIIIGLFTITTLIAVFYIRQFKPFKTIS